METLVGKTPNSEQGPQPLDSKINNLSDMADKFDPETAERNKAQVEYQRAAKDTEYWHGTGRYQYGNDGQVIDILQSVFKNGGLIPQHEDNYNPEQAGQLSTSLGLNRDVSLKYADANNKNPTAIERNLTWQAFFQHWEDTKEAIAERTKAKGRAEGKTDEEAMAERWQQIQKQRPYASHYRKNAGHEPVKETFMAGSDIEGNYSMLFGVRHLDTAKSPEGLANHEVRVEGGVPLNQITHIEVPRDKINETQERIHSIKERLSSEGKNIPEIPVVAIETGEQVGRN